MCKIYDQQTYRYLGAIHIHSDFSDGTGSLMQIVNAAKNAGLDWIIITDHNSLEVEEGYIDGVLVLRGEEISPRDNHYLALGTSSHISEYLTPAAYVQEVRHQGGFGFAAHPDESLSRKNSARAIRWLDKSVKPDGVEIWNWFSTWADNYSDKNIFKLAYAYFFKHNLITKPKLETLEWWDKLNTESEEIVPAIGGVDAHALKIHKYVIPVTIFPYDEIFKTLTNVVFLQSRLSDDFKTAKSQILSAICNGRNLIVNRYLCKKIPQICVKNSFTIVGIGESLEYDSVTCFEIKLEKKFKIKLFCNGEIIWAGFTDFARVPLNKKGKYRVAVESKELGYAYSNPIIVS